MTSSSKGAKDAIIKWDIVTEETEDFSRVLYAYVSRSGKLLYIGKAWGSTVKERFTAADKDNAYEYLESLGHKKVIVIVGIIYLYDDKRLTHELMIDIESLLIIEEQPLANVKNMITRGYGRKGFKIHCKGSWPGKRNYTDPGPTP